MALEVIFDVFDGFGGESRLAAEFADLRVDAVNGNFVFFEDERCASLSFGPAAIANCRNVFHF